MPDALPISKLRSRRQAPKPGRIRCAAHLAYVRTQPCLVPGCWSKPSEAHHLRCCDDPRGGGIRSGDRWTVPCCHRHHGEVQHADERAWGKAHGTDLEEYAAILWAASVKAGRYRPRSL